MFASSPCSYINVPYKKLSYVLWCWQSSSAHFSIQLNKLRDNNIYKFYFFYSYFVYLHFFLFFMYLCNYLFCLYFLFQKDSSFFNMFYNDIYIIFVWLDAGPPVFPKDFFNRNGTLPGPPPSSCPGRPAPALPCLSPQTGNGLHKERASQAFQTTMLFPMAGSAAET